MARVSISDHVAAQARPRIFFCRRSAMLRPPKAFPSTKQEYDLLFPKGLPMDRLYTKDILALKASFTEDGVEIRAFQKRAQPLLRRAATAQRAFSAKAAEDIARLVKRQSPKGT